MRRFSLPVGNSGRKSGRKYLRREEKVDSEDKEIGKKYKASISSD